MNYNDIKESLDKIDYLETENLIELDLGTVVIGGYGKVFTTEDKNVLIFNRKDIFKNALYYAGLDYLELGDCSTSVETPTSFLMVIEADLDQSGRTQELLNTLILMKGNQWLNT